MAFRLRQWLVPTLKLHRRHKCPNNETRETPPSRISLWFLVLLRSKWPLFVVFTCGVVWRVLLLCVWDCVTIIAGVRKKEICYGCWATNRTMRQLNKGASLTGKNNHTRNSVCLWYCGQDQFYICISPSIIYNQLLFSFGAWEGVRFGVFCPLSLIVANGIWSNCAGNSKPKDPQSH